MSGDTLQHQRVYEETPHRLAVSLLEHDYDVSAAVNVIDLFGDGSALVLERLLSGGECEAIRRQGQLFGMSGCGYPSSFRVCDRVSAMGDEFAAALLRRAAPFVGDSVHFDSEAARPRGVPKELPLGRYTLSGVNPCFRVVRYQPGGFFYPHYDYGFEQSSTVTSIKTFMMYLNDDFTGGPTRFFNAQQRHYVEPQEANVVVSYTPKPGSCLVFNHHITHDGGAVISGEKWLFRTELMYTHPIDEQRQIDQAFAQLDQLASIEY